MQSTTGNARIVRQVADGTPGQALDLLGPVAEFVTEPQHAEAAPRLRPGHDFDSGHE